MNQFFSNSNDDVSFSTKQKRLDMIDNQQTVFNSFYLCSLFDNCKSQQRVHGGDKQTEKPRVRKRFNDNIVIPQSLFSKII